MADTTDLETLIGELIGAGRVSVDELDELVCEICAGEAACEANHGADPDAAYGAADARAADINNGGVGAQAQFLTDTIGTDGVELWLGVVPAGR